MSASWSVGEFVVGELVCRRVGLSASWSVGELVVGELVCRRVVHKALIAVISIGVLRLLTRSIFKGYRVQVTITVLIKMQFRTMYASGLEYNILNGLPWRMFALGFHRKCYYPSPAADNLITGVCIVCVLYYDPPGMDSSMTCYSPSSPITSEARVQIRGPRSLFTIKRRNNTYDVTHFT